MSTARAIIEGALRAITVLSRGMPLAAEDANDAFAALNLMLASWNSRKSPVLARTRVTHTLTSGTATYTIGSGATIDAARPLAIDAAFLRESDRDYGLRVMGSDRYDSIAYKATPGRPGRIYYEPGPSTGTIRLDKAPSSAYVLHLTTLAPLTAVASLDTEIGMAAEAEDAIKYNLAVRMAPEYGREASRTVQILARDTLADYETWVGSFRIPQPALDPMLLVQGQAERGIYDFEAGD